ncbi:hypothetical protein [Flammeovirga kamogawensis]|uniref:DUF4293 family protein n=1 Tax=Flammeovirga kamogawensis TaxID=373891 RepID=A0ABX8GTH8_9BACT|nr:hypothetical protein [Flammeovirga kamogawensis]MBB6460060.1 putative membrane protein [Flammeovirga kamogawensis]QWG06894.1 hypothetical protein KM029_16530 [Flammeovirga kamogawensis]TRX68715.1 hypothetical protein EO216_11525 [Flammeovirga kamogawensis]
MIKALKFLTIGLWILILTIWIGDLWIGIRTDVSDDVTRGIVEPMRTDMDNAIQTRRTLSVLILIPALTIFGLIIYGIQKKKNHLFYIGMTLTIIPILTIGILGLIQESEMPYKNVILLILCTLLIFGLIKGLKEIYEYRKLKLENK